MAGNTDLDPTKGLQGSSPVYDMGTTPNTRTAVSQKVRILTPAYGTSSALFQMGVLYNFAPSQNRNIEEVRSIGFGDIVPAAKDILAGKVRGRLVVEIG